MKKGSRKLKQLYPGVAEAEAEKSRKTAEIDEAPDFINGKPNYDKFGKRDTERVLVWLNID